LGAALARELAAPGRTLYLSGRNRARLDSTAAACRGRGATVVVVAFDMADPVDREYAVKRVLASQPLPQVLINNAGLSQRGRAAETDLTVDRTLMEVDYMGGVALTKALLPTLISAKAGCIVAVSSVAGLAPVPERSSYNAAKAAQISFFGTLGNELHRDGVQVLIVVPGFVRTEISRNALTGAGKPHNTMDPNQASGISPAEAARAVVEAMRARKRRVYPGMTPKLRLMLLLAKLAPNLLDRLLRTVGVR
jgi:short-subunit dehydrogenase